ncbi:GDSL esterase/lipase-like [Pistacia vera]|uniref:GDSL esterase/lipase-like n=1 Tax=Pistacia vera TaxID=55513 RepID=UPI001262B5E5|nr:GDSL esterase/lipase-like [Pistacia vera]
MELALLQLDQISLLGQLANFKKVASSLDKEVLMRSVFLFSMGGNDYLIFNLKNPNATIAERRKFQRMVIGNSTNTLQEIYELGGRKFAFKNVAPAGCLPLIKQVYHQFNGSCFKERMIACCGTGQFNGQNCGGGVTGTNDYE